MKTKLLFIVLSLGIISTQAQTTHHLDWFAGMGTNVDLTIESGDTVTWTWTSPNHTVESLPESVETFDSGFFGPIGSTFSYTFTLEGDNPYFCGVHGVASMSGTITVENSLSIDDSTLKTFKIVENPANATLQIEIPPTWQRGSIVIHDVNGKEVFISSFSETPNMNINISSLSKGMYLLTINAGKVKQTKRFIKI